MRYEREINPGANDSLSKVVGMIEQESTVLDLGVGAGRLGQYLSEHRGCTVDGVEGDAQFVALATPFYRQLLNVDLEDPHWSDAFERRSYDVVVCADILEHLVNGERVLTQLQTLLKDEGQVIISIPNIAYVGVALEVLEGRFKYRDEGILDRTHLRFYTRDTLCEFIEAAGYSIDSIDTVDTPLSESEFSEFVPELLPASLYQLIQNRADAFVYQYVVAVRPSGGPQAPRSLPDKSPASIHNNFVAGVFWMSNSDLNFIEEKSAQQLLKLNDENNHVVFSVDDKDSIEYLRLAPADREGTLRISALSIEDADSGESHDLCELWEGLGDAVQSQHLTVAPIPGHGLSLLLHRDTAWLELDLKQIFKQHLPCKVVLKWQCAWPKSQDYVPLLKASEEQIAQQKDLVDKVVEYRAHMRGLRSEVFELKDKLDAMVGERDRWEAHSDGLDVQLKAVQGSRAWKLIMGFGGLKVQLKTLLKHSFRTPAALQLMDVEGLVNSEAHDSLDQLEVEGGESKIWFSLDGQQVQGDAFFEIDYDSREPLMGPKLQYRCQEHLREEPAYVYEDRNGRALFGTIDIPRDAQAIALIPGRLSNAISIKRFVIRPMGFVEKYVYDNTWYKFLRVFGQRWVLERWREKAQQYAADFPRITDRLYPNWWLRFGAPSAQELEYQREASGRFALQPKISIIMPVYNVPSTYLVQAFDSVLGQTYTNWELCVADDCSTNADTLDTLAHYAKVDVRINVIHREVNGHISAASNSALEIASGDFVAFLDHDDELSPQALYRVVSALNDQPGLKFLYSDEDIIDEDGNHMRGHFKPEWNPDLIRSINYICHFLVIEKTLVDAVDGFRESYEGAQDYDLVLRVLAKMDAQQITRIPYVLYHWRAIEGSTANDVSAKDYAKDAGIKALQSYLDETGEEAIAEPSEVDTAYRVRYALPIVKPLASIIIPSRNSLTILKHCVTSVMARTDYENYEIIIVDNQSDDEECLDYLAQISEIDNVRLLQYDLAFNYSAINNFAVERANGDVLVFLNNDIEVVNDDWLSEMISHALRLEIGAVGAKLFYASDHLQHAGVVLGLGPDKIAGHAYKGFHKYEVGLLGRLRVIQNYSAVTAACMVIERAKFEQVGGFDEVNLQIAFNDVDLCLKVREAGYRNLWTPYAQLYHFESFSRGYDNASEKRERFLRERDFMRNKWGALLDHDPAYNPNLTRDFENFTAAWPPLL